MWSVDTNYNIFQSIFTLIPMNSNVTGRVIFEAVHEKLLDTKDSSARCGRYDGHIDQL